MHFEIIVSDFCIPSSSKSVWLSQRDRKKKRHKGGGGLEENGVKWSKARDGTDSTERNRGGSCHNNIPFESASLLSPSSCVTSNNAENHWRGNSTHRHKRTFTLAHTGKLPAVDSTDWYRSVLNGPSSYSHWPLSTHLRMTALVKARTTCHDDWMCCCVYQYLCCFVFAPIPLALRPSLEMIFAL